MVTADLLKKAQAGDKEAVTEILTQYSPLVKSVSAHFFLLGGDREDLIQEGMIGLYSAISSFREDDTAKFSAYAKKCVRNAIIDAVRKRNGASHAALNDSVPILEVCDLVGDGDIEDEIIRKEDAREFLQKISRGLSSYEFKVLVMYLDGMTCAETAEALKKEPKSVGNALSRVKEKIARLYGGEE